LKAIVYNRYGTPEELRVAEVERPAPKDNEVLVRVQAASVNAADWHLLTADIFLVRFSSGLIAPKHPILGFDIAGHVESVGRSVTRFRAGDIVFGDIGLGVGAFAEYTSVPEHLLCRMPAGLTFEEAAAVPLAAVTALQGLRDIGRVQPGNRVVIQGASGGVGTFAVQIAKALGAEVTAVCSPRNLTQAQALGADHVIDYTRENFTRNGQRYDVILAANGFRAIGDYRRALTPRGVYAMAGGAPAQMFEALLLGGLMSSRVGQSLRVVSAKPDANDLAVLKEWIEAGKLKPVIDRRYPLEQTADALRYLGEGHARGKIVIQISAETRDEARSVPA